MDNILPKTYIGFETAKLLKEAGFNEPCYVYFEYGDYLDSYCFLERNTYPRCEMEYVQKWFRCRKNIYVFATPVFMNENKIQYRIDVYRNREEAINCGIEFFKNDYKPIFDFYYEALEMAIQKACQILINEKK